MTTRCPSDIQWTSYDLLTGMIEDNRIRGRYNPREKLTTNLDDLGMCVRKLWLCFPMSHSFPWCVSAGCTLPAPLVSGVQSCLIWWLCLMPSKILVQLACALPVSTLDRGASVGRQSCFFLALHASEASTLNNQVKNTQQPSERE